MRLFLIIIFGIISIFLLFIIEIQLISVIDVKPDPEELYTKDGCTFYRMYDKGDRHYFKKCNHMIGSDEYV